MINPAGILMIEPKERPSKKPLIDSYTKKMTAALRKARKPTYVYRGFHNCKCGARSDNFDHIVKDGNGEERLTNSLSVHYLAFHRDEVSHNELARVGSLTYGEEVPNDWELNIPQGSSLF